MTGWELLKEIADGPLEDDDAAREFLTRAGVRAVNATALLLPIIKDRIWHERRSNVRHIERGGSKRRTFGEIYDSVDARKKLLAERFFLGDGTSVLWGEATVEQHEQRVAMLQGQREGIDATITSHLDAIRKILEHGGSCLDDIEDAA